MSDDIPCVIVEMSDLVGWPGFAHLPSSIRQIPAHRRPAVLQPNRATAEREATRLARMHPAGRFVIFEAVAVGQRVEIPTHTNLRGDVLIRRSEPAVLELDHTDIPF